MSDLNLQRSKTPVEISGNGASAPSFCQSFDGKAHCAHSGYGDESKRGTSLRLGPYLVECHDIPAALLFELEHMFVRPS